MQLDAASFIRKPSLGCIASQACTAEQFLEPHYSRLAAEIAQRPTYHRKQWEYIYILRALEQLDLLRPGATGLGFGCGQEPITAAMAKHGLVLIITDIPPVGITDAHWGSKSLMDSFYRGICTEEEYRRQVSFRAVNMNQIPDDLGLHDFVWSCCALEHLGSLKSGLDFIVNSTKCLKPGGVAIHTTEYNVSDDSETLESPGLSLYRKVDLMNLQSRLIEQGCSVLPMNFYAGTLPEDQYVDLPPYSQTIHLKLQIEKFVVTSFGLVLRKDH